MTLGVYTLYLNAVASIQFSILIPIGIGLIIGGFLFLKLIQFLFAHYYSQTFYAIIGFVLGSVFVLYPGFSFTLEGLFSIILLVIGFIIGSKFEKLDSHSS